LNLCWYTGGSYIKNRLIVNMAFEKSDDLTVNFRAMSLSELMLAVAEIQRDLVELRRAFVVKRPIPSPTEPNIVGRKSPSALNECRSPVKSRTDLFFQSDKSQSPGSRNLQSPARKKKPADFSPYSPIKLSGM
jgi:hypothetical protein